MCRAHPAEDDWCSQAEPWCRLSTSVVRRAGQSTADGRQKLWKWVPLDPRGQSSAGRTRMRRRVLLLAPEDEGETRVRSRRRNVSHSLHLMLSAASVASCHLPFLLPLVRKKQRYETRLHTNSFIHEYRVTHFLCVCCPCPPTTEPGHAYCSDCGPGLRGVSQTEPAAHAAECRRAGGRQWRQDRQRLHCQRYVSSATLGHWDNEQAVRSSALD